MDLKFAEEEAAAFHPRLTVRQFLQYNSAAAGHSNDYQPNQVALPSRLPILSPDEHLFYCMRQASSLQLESYPAPSKCGSQPDHVCPAQHAESIDSWETCMVWLAHRCIRLSSYLQPPPRRLHRMVDPSVAVIRVSA